MSAAHDHHHGPAKGISRWLFTTNHKDIGSMYLWFSFAMFLLGGTFALVIRAELFQPGLQFVEPNFFNQMTTMHGLIMVFGAVMPAFVGLANWMIPLMIGAPDMALPRMNNWSFWILPFAFAMMVSTLFMDGGGPNFGWTFYAPLSTTYAPPSTTFFIFAVHILGVSKVMEPRNMVATQLNTFTPVGTAISMVAYMKNSWPARGMPTVNMWCAQTMKDRKAIDAVAYTMESYPNRRLRAKVGMMADTIPNAGRIMM